MSYSPGPEAFAVNVFPHSWVGYNFYAFPPFCLISKVLQKIRKEESDGLVILPSEVDNPVMVASGHENADTNTGDSSKKNINFVPSK